MPDVVLAQSVKPRFPPRRHQHSGLKPIHWAALLPSSNDTELFRRLDDFGCVKSNEQGESEPNKISVAGQPVFRYRLGRRSESRLD